MAALPALDQEHETKHDTTKGETPHRKVDGRDRYRYRYPSAHSARDLDELTVAFFCLRHYLDLESAQEETILNVIELREGPLACTQTMTFQDNDFEVSNAILSELDGTQIQQRLGLFSRPDRPLVQLRDGLVLWNGQLLQPAAPIGWSREPGDADARLFAQQNSSTMFHWVKSNEIQVFEAGPGSGSGSCQPAEIIDLPPKSRFLGPSTHLVQNVVSLSTRDKLVVITADFNYLRVDGVWVMLPRLSIRDSLVQDLTLYVLYDLSATEQGIALLDIDSKQWMHVYSFGEKHQSARNSSFCIRHLGFCLPRPTSVPSPQESLAQNGYITFQHGMILSLNTYKLLRETTATTYANWPPSFEPFGADKFATKLRFVFTLEQLKTQDSISLSLSPPCPDYVQALIEDILQFLPAQDYFVEVLFINDFGHVERAARQLIQSKNDDSLSLEMAPLHFHQDRNSQHPNDYLFFMILESSEPVSMLQIGHVAKEKILKTTANSTDVAHDYDVREVSQMSGWAGTGYLINENYGDGDVDGFRIVHAHGGVRLSITKEHQPGSVGRRKVIVRFTAKKSQLVQ